MCYSTVKEEVNDVDSYFRGCGCRCPRDQQDNVKQDINLNSQYTHRRNRTVNEKVLCCFNLPDLVNDISI